MTPPWWSSFEDVRSAHSFFEVGALVLFAALVVFEFLEHLKTKREALFKILALTSFGLAVLFEICAYPYSKRNDELSGNEIRGLSGVSQQARIDARAAVQSGKEAKGVAAQASTLASGARQEADSFEQRIVTANEIATKAESHLAEALREAAEANRKLKEDIEARVKIEKQLAPRRLMSSSSDEIATRIRPFAPNFSSRKVSISSYVADPEGIFFCLQLLYLFKLAGISVDDAGIGRGLPVGMIDLGIIVTGPLADEAFVNALVDGIRKHLPVTERLESPADANPDDVRGECGPQYKDVHILVAAKPMPGIPDVKKFFEKHPSK